MGNVELAFVVHWHSTCVRIYHVDLHVVATKHGRFEAARNTNRTLFPTSNGQEHITGGRYIVEVVSDQRIPCLRVMAGCSL